MDEIFKKVFNEEELNAIYQNKENEKNEDKKDENKEEGGGFFTTQAQA